MRHETNMPYCWCNPKKIVMKNGNMIITHNNKTMSQKYKTIHKEITLNPKVLENCGSVVDFINLVDEKISIRLIIKKAEQIDENGNQIQATFYTKNDK